MTTHRWSIARRWGGREVCGSTLPLGTASTDAHSQPRRRRPRLWSLSAGSRRPSCVFLRLSPQKGLWKKKDLNVRTSLRRRGGIDCIWCRRCNIVSKPRDTSTARHALPKTTSEHLTSLRLAVTTTTRKIPSNTGRRYSLFPLCSMGLARNVQGARAVGMTTLSPTDANRRIIPREGSAQQRR